jgi:SAM-dependent methyltransferase
MDRAYYEQYYELEREHWWFRARLKILESLLLSQVLPKMGGGEKRILNAGIATGATSVMLQNFGQVTSLEYDDECVRFVRESVGIEVDQGSLTELPYPSSSFDLVCAFDVVEHIEEHQKALLEIYRVLQPRGVVFLTVPAFQFLWSEHDVVNHHYRRYRLRQLMELLKSCGFAIRKRSYFNCFLFPMVAGARLISSRLPKVTKSESEIESDFSRFQTGGFGSSILRNVFEAEKYFVSRGLTFPFGVSAFAIAQKGG